MSFSSEAKTELCRVPLSRVCCARAEAYGVLLYCHTFDRREIRIITANDAFAQRLPKLFRRAFSLAFDHVPPEGAAGKRTFLITAPEKILAVLEVFGQESTVSHHINYGMLETDCCRQSFFRGAFLAGGSVTDPLKRYHLELATPHLQAGREVEALLRDMGYEPKNVQRQGNGVTYFKQSDHIEELLTRIGAPAAAMEVMAAKVEKEMRNTVNRRVNCDAANVDKAVAASREQVEALTRLTDAGVVATLPVKLQEVAVARLLQPELSLSELAETFDPPLTKSCLNHRMRKLMELAGKEKA